MEPCGVTQPLTIRAALESFFFLQTLQMFFGISIRKYCFNLKTVKLNRNFNSFLQNKSTLFYPKMQFDLVARCMFVI